MSDNPLLAEVHRLSQGGAPMELPRHRHNLSREQVELTQRARIILATAEAVTQEGYAKVSTREIIARAGVSSRTFYASYASKEEAFLAGYTLLDDRVVGFLRAPAVTTAPRADTRRGTQRFLERLAAWPLFTRMRLVEGRAAGRIADQQRIDLGNRMAAGSRSPWRRRGRSTRA